MKEIEVELEGTNPLLMCNPASMTGEKTKRIVKEVDHAKEAEESAYRASDGSKELIIPANNIYAALIAAASGYKVGKKSAIGLLAGTIKIEPVEIKLGKKNYDVDVRGVVIKGAGRVMKARALVKDWKAKFTIVYNDEYLPSDFAKNTLYQITKEAGIRYGLMAYRPQRKGWFGTFVVKKWDAE